MDKCSQNFLCDDKSFEVSFIFVLNVCLRQWDKYRKCIVCYLKCYIIYAKKQWINNGALVWVSVTQHTLANPSKSCVMYLYYILFPLIWTPSSSVPFPHLVHFDDVNPAIAPGPVDFPHLTPHRSALQKPICSLTSRETLSFCFNTFISNQSKSSATKR